MAEPEEVGHLAAYLTSDVAGFVTGATYTLDGGVTRH
jgi:3-hydroxybutyrate dehydrogenase